MFTKILKWKELKYQLLMDFVSRLNYLPKMIDLQIGNKQPD